MMETSPDMEFLRPFLKDEWRVAGYSVDGDTHHVLFQNPTEMRALTFQTKDETGNGQAVVVGYEESIFID